MVDVDMKPMPPRIIGRKTCLWNKGPLGLSKDLQPDLITNQPNWIFERKSKKANQ
jgi:hypothetical protein